MQKYLLITLGQQDPLTLKFRIKNTSLAKLWLERMGARTGWQIDHRDRFYCFGTPFEERAKAVEYIQKCISTINLWEPIIHREFEYTQDCLNYLHNIFERYHGMLDQQNSEYWTNAPDTVRKALADLNLAVHRCESVAAGSHPRFVCTWYGMPKTHKLDLDIQETQGAWKIQFGTVYLNYCEIGKTAEDLAYDNDKYIGDEMFRPFNFYSADFNVQFYDRDLKDVYGLVQNYINQNKDFFLAHNVTSVYNVKVRPMRFPVAELEFTGTREELLFQIAKRQWISNVEII